MIARDLDVEGVRMIAETTECQWQEDADGDPFARNLNMGLSSIGRMEESTKDDQ